MTLLKIEEVLARQRATKLLDNLTEIARSMRSEAFVDSEYNEDIAEFAKKQYASVVSEIAECAWIEAGIQKITHQDNVMKKSDSITELATALNLAQQQMGGAVKDSKNPFFKSSYADLTSVIKAIKEPLNSNGLSYLQFPVTSAGGNGVGVETILMHKSGEWISNEYVMPLSKNDAQGAASCITYARRYALQSIVGLPTADDDGEAAMIRKKPEESQKTKDARKVYSENKDVIQGFLKSINDEYVADEDKWQLWSSLSDDCKKALWLPEVDGGFLSTDLKKKITELRKRHSQAMSLCADATQFSLAGSTN